MATTPTAPEAFLGGGAYPPTYAVVRHIVDFLRWRFSCLPPGAYQWRPEGNDLNGDGQSEIYIGSDTPINTTTIGQRPAITVLRSQAAFSGLGMNDLAFVDLRTGAKAKMDMLPTTLMINVLSAHDVEAERIAWFVQEQLSAFREVIIKTLPSILYLGQRISMGAPSPAGSLVNSSEYEWTVVVLAMPTFLQHATHTLPLNKPVLSGATITATTVGPPKTTPTLPVVPLQGTAVSQSLQTNRDRSAALAGSSDLPQEGSNEAKSTSPLTVTFKA